MISIIPNWHPFLVHFTIGLLLTAVLFYWLAALLPATHRWKQQWSNTANWLLWSGCLVTLLTVTAGWYAYNTVAHDAAAHAAMTLHRNWALPTAALFLLLGLSAILLARQALRPGLLFLCLSMAAAIMLLITGYLGAETVYRHGLGVMALPDLSSEHHHHDGGDTDHESSDTQQHIHNHDE